MMMTPTVLLSGTFLVAAVCAAIMGYAIQRGATCMVAAIDEVLTRRRAHRLIALAEAAVWVSGGLLLASLVGKLKMPPAAFPLGLATVYGGTLLGIGALINRACVFGAIARLGSGEWAYALTPAGFFCGCLAAGRLMAPVMSVASASPLFGAAPVLIIPILLFGAWRGFEALVALRGGRFVAHIWSPHRATMVIGLAFVVMLLTVGNWAYTDALASLAHGMANDVTAKMLLFMALLIGALLGGWTAGRLRFVAPTGARMARCLIGGAMMGMGSVLIPGGNDGLILIGLPLLQPYAVLALACMTLAIAMGMLIERRLAFASQ